jgi:hypothetical protein
MSVLTQSERDGLDEVFLSIHTNNKNYIKGLFDLTNFKKVLKKLFNTTKLKHVLVYCKNIKSIKRV